MMLRRSSHSAKGQLAIGLLMCFTAAVCLFGLILESTVFVREKIAAQHVTDLASMMGANVQRHNVNQIIELNRVIERDFEILALVLQASFCVSELASYAQSLTQLVPIVTAVTQKSFPPPPSCNTVCRTYDAHRKNQLINMYKDLQGQRAQAGRLMNAEANALGFEFAQKVLLSPDVLPPRLRHKISERLANRMSLDRIQTQWRNNQFDDFFQIVFPTQPQMLNLGTETRIVPITTYVYSESTTAPQAPCVPVSVAPGIPVSLPAKMVRKDDNIARFSIGLRYQMPKGPLHGIFQPKLRHPVGFEEVNAPVFGPESTGRAEIISTIALAKPFGGTYPQENDILSGTGLGFINLLPIDQRGIGKPFEGVKLIGLGDLDEQGGNPLWENVAGFPEVSEIFK